MPPARERQATRQYPPWRWCEIGEYRANLHRLTTDRSTKRPQFRIETFIDQPSKKRNSMSILPSSGLPEDVMFAAIENLPHGAIGFVAHRRITAFDRNTVLKPTVESALEYGKVRLLYVIGEDFRGYDLGGLYDDVVFGSEHFNDFERIAFVAHDGPFRRAATAMEGLMPAALQVFGPSHVEDAKTWLGTAQAAGPVRFPELVA
jgi:hypothetical protein